MAYLDKYNENIYINFFNNDRNGYITQLGRVIPLPGYGFSNRKLSRHLFDYIVSGRGYVEVDGIREEVAEGDLVFIRKGVSAAYGTNDDDPYEKYWIGSGGPAIDALIDCYLGDKAMTIRHGFDPEPIIRLKSIVASPSYDEKRIMYVLLELILELADLPDQGAPASNKRLELASKVRKYIDDRVTERISLDEIAEHFHISKRHMLRVFKEEFGVTPGAYHSEIRLIAASRYLSDTSFSIGEIALMLGYSDQSFFSTAFKKKFGIYPTAYRRDAQSTGIIPPIPKE